MASLMVTIKKKIMMSMMIVHPHQGHCHDDEHDDLASPPGSLTSGWRARGMREARRKAAFSCRPELDPAMAEVEPAADYIPPLFRHCTQSRVFDKYVLDRRF